jgi:hypothetical protein
VARAPDADFARRAVERAADPELRAELEALARRA